MSSYYRTLLGILVSIWCSSAFADPHAVARGEYLTSILGCGGCHTEGALLGQPSGPWLAGSRIGVAYTADDGHDRPGVVFPSNLTRDVETGLGTWSKADIVRVLRSGTTHGGTQVIPVMPWANYALLKDEDLSDIADYLIALDAIKYAIPDNIARGELSLERYVRIGVYLFMPDRYDSE